MGQSSSVSRNIEASGPIPPEGLMRNEVGQEEHDGRRGTKIPDPWSLPV